MINYLKEQIIYKARREIKNRGDCEHLSQLIEIETGDNINYNTLRRFFDIDKQKFKPRVATLNILSRYIGYNSFKDLSTFNPQKLFFDQNLKTYELLLKFNPEQIASTYKSLNFNTKLNLLIQVCRHGILTKQIDELCLCLNKIKITVKTFPYDLILVIGNSIGILLRNIRLPKKDWDTLLNNYFFNRCVFEIFVDYSSLNSYYYRFIKHPHYNEQQKLLKVSLKCIRDYLNLKKVKLTIQKIAPDELKKLHPILAGRILSINLYRNKSTIKNFEAIETITVEHLYEPMITTVITSNFELYNLIKSIFYKSIEFEIYQHFHYYQVYLLLKSCYLYKSEHFKKALASIQEINPDDFRISYKELLSFFYYLLHFKLTDTDNSRIKAIKISQNLGYKRLDYNFIDDY